jgi:hypothetical protein
MDELAVVLLGLMVWAHPLNEFFVGVLGSEGYCGGSENLGSGRPPKSMRWNVLANDCARFDNRALANSDVGQNDAVRSYEDVLFNDDGAFVLSAARTPVEMRKDSSAQSDGAVVPDGDAIGVAIVDVNEVREPNVFADVDATQAMEPRPQAASTRTDERENVEETAEQIGKHGITFPAY